MRISDWSSDVCSSDLLGGRAAGGSGSALRPADNAQHSTGKRRLTPQALLARSVGRPLRRRHSPPSPGRRHPCVADRDRKSVVSGKSVSVRVDLGGRRIIKKKKHTKINNETTRK